MEQRNREWEEIGRMSRRGRNKKCVGNSYVFNGGIYRIKDYLSKNMVLGNVKTMENWEDMSDAYLPLLDFSRRYETLLHFLEFHPLSSAIGIPCLNWH